MFQRNFKSKVRTAAAWAIPSHECVGYSQAELSTLLYRCLERIEYLEETLRENSVAFSETDWSPAQQGETIKDI